MKPLQNISSASGKFLPVKNVLAQTDCHCPYEHVSDFVTCKYSVLSWVLMTAWALRTSLFASIVIGWISLRQYFTSMRRKKRVQQFYWSAAETHTPGCDNRFFTVTDFQTYTFHIKTWKEAQWPERYAQYPQGPWKMVLLTDASQQGLLNECVTWGMGFRWR